MVRQLTVAASVSVAVLLAGCTAVVPPPPEEERFVARQLDAVSLTLDDFGSTWALSDDPETGSGGGPSGEQIEYADPCSWSSAWTPDQSAFYTHTWRTFTTGDGATFSMAWIAAVDPDVDPAEQLAALAEKVAACGTNPDPGAQPDGTVTLVPDILPQLGDGSFSYRADFEHPDYGLYGLGEVHTVLCGQLWVHLSYVGLEAFVERDDLLATFLERVAPLGGCEA